jgi:lipopolysaccharide/colanic/teichoic acid biosynthesis glycosyltransferase
MGESGHLFFHDDTFRLWAACERILDDVVAFAPTHGARPVRRETRDSMAVRVIQLSRFRAPALARAGGGSLLRRSTLRLSRPGYERAKRVFDLTLCLLVLPAALLAIGACALAVGFCDGRPIFFFQDRTGRGGRRFRMYKFRTMVVNAAELKSELASLNHLSGPDFKIENDPRVTRLGAFLRKTSLDEIPQIVNVLRGEMSLVGPRPTSFAASTYDLWHTERLEVLPGITGLWQVSGRSDIDFDDRVRLDIEYLERRSFWFDLVILFRTAAALVQQRGAY